MKDVDNTICEHYNLCGGCSLQDIPYETQLKNKKDKVLKLLSQKGIINFNFLGIEASPNIFNYRNKMEFSFGYFQGEKKLQLGMHPRNDPNNVITVDKCEIIDSDFRKILSTTLEYFRKQGLPPYNVMSRKGYLRHLIVRKGINSGEIIVNLVTTSQHKNNNSELVKKLNSLNLKDKIIGILHTINNGFSDAVECDRLITLYGRDYFIENILDKRFKIKPFSFFQVNSRSAEKLYKTIIEFLDENNQKIDVLYDLYCGTGTISQLVSSQTSQVIGIEIDQDAVITARENAKLNNINNCSFICGDVGSKIKRIKENADTIIVNPPRAGLDSKVINYLKLIKAPQLIYSSCNPETLARDLHQLTDNLYQLDKVKCIDMFPHTPHIETCTHLSI
ncbi:MAG: 23S rRNA (uracil(1939)-C(5))-methyltransferase RlmD [Halanaerobiales bacterium]